MHVESYSGPEKGAFEVMVGSKLIHSKLKNPKHGKVQTDEELDAILDYITEALDARRSSTPQDQSTAG